MEWARNYTAPDGVPVDPPGRDPQTEADTHCWAPEHWMYEAWVAGGM